MQDTSDVEFVVGGKSIHAHKTILVLRCEHFKTMFSGDWKESTAKLVPVIMQYKTKLSFNLATTIIKRFHLC